MNVPVQFWKILKNLIMSICLLGGVVLKNKINSYFLIYCTSHSESLSNDSPLYLQKYRHIPIFQFEKMFPYVNIFFYSYTIIYQISVLLNYFLSKMNSWTIGTILIFLIFANIVNKSLITNILKISIYSPTKKNLFVI